MMRAVAAAIVAGAVLVGIPVHAETPVADLIDEAGLSAGPQPMRERPGWRKPKKIVLRDGYDIVERLRQAFPDVEFVVADTPPAAAAAIRDADAVLGTCEDGYLSGPGLQWVQIYSAGAEHCLGNDALASGRVLLTNMQKMSSPVIAEHAIAMMMALARGLVPYAKNMEDGGWDRALAQRSHMTSLQGKTVLVVGLGGIGTAVARRAAGLRMRVLATRNSSREGPDFVEYVGLPDELPGLAGRADVIVNALPLTPQTTNIFDEAFFAAAKPGALFINVARGGSVVTAALVRALEDGRIAGAGLDVTEPEPLPPGHALWDMDNVIITPHVAGFGNERDDYPVLLEENVRRFIAGDALLNVVDPARGY